MSNKNRRVREELERIYGKRCMYHQGIRNIKPPRVSNKKYKGKSIENQLTFAKIYDMIFNTSGCLAWQ